MAFLKRENLRINELRSTHALIFGAPRWIAFATGNIHMKTSQEQKYDASHLYELFSS